MCLEVAMNTKLTLTIEQDVIETAKAYANEKGQSLSELVENYFRLITSSSTPVKPSRQATSKVRKLRGILKASPDLDYKQLLTEELSKKYGV